MVSRANSMEPTIPNINARFNAIEMTSTAGKFMLTMIHTEMLLIPHIHQPIVAPPAVRVDDTVEGYLAPNRSL